MAPAPKPLAIENYLRVVGLFYLFIGLFIFVRRWNAARAVHFYIFCLVSFILCSFHYTGKLNLFDWEVYWARAAAMLLAPALLLHFALVFPERSIARRLWHRLWIVAAYVPRSLAAGARRCRHQLAGLRSFAAGARGARSDRTRLSRPLLPAGRGDFPAQLPARAAAAYCGSN